MTEDGGRRADLRAWDRDPGKADAAGERGQGGRGTEAAQPPARLSWCPEQNPWGLLPSNPPPVPLQPGWN